MTICQITCKRQPAALLCRLTLFVLALLAITAWTPGDLRAEARLEGTNPAQWRVIWTEHPATRAVLCWNTAKAGSKHELRYRRRGADSFETNATTSGEYAGDGLHWHRSELSGLQPGTEYEVQMVSDGRESPVLFFVTAPAEDRPFTLLFGGDSRSSSEHRRAVNQMLSELVEQSLDNDEPADDILALVHGGDYIATGSDLSQWSQWMSDHELTVTDEGRLLPIIPARGNHDRGALFNPVFGFPEDDTNQYVTTIADQLTLITLSTNESTAGDQARWLEDQLETARPGTRWLLAQYHRPAYAAVKSPGSALRDWVPLFEKFNVDLVCEADGHCIKRTLPIRDGKHDPTGIVYVGEGGLGVGQRSPKSDRWFVQPPGMVGHGHHVQALTFSRDELLYRCIMLDGEVRDEYRRKPRKQTGG